MTDYVAEQEMEMEALTAIFMDDLQGEAGRPPADPAEPALWLEKGVEGTAQRGGKGTAAPVRCAPPQR